MYDLIIYKTTDEIYNHLLELGMYNFEAKREYMDKELIAKFQIKGSLLIIKAPWDEIKNFKSSLEQLLDKRLEFKHASE